MWKVYEQQPQADLSSVNLFIQLFILFAFIPTNKQNKYDKSYKVEAHQGGVGLRQGNSAKTLLGGQD